ncbi:MAG: hypothetical protein AB7F86_16955 [Bdellovibrionales bacterium]
MRTLIVGLLAVVTALVIEFRNYSRRSVEKSRAFVVRDEAVMVRTLIEGRIRHPEICSSSISGVAASPGQRVEIEMDATIGNASSLMAGQQLSPNLVLTSLQLDTGENPDMRTEILDSRGLAVSLQRYHARLLTGFQDTQGQPVFAGTGNGTLFASRSFYVWLDSSGIVQSCFGRESSGTLCNELGGYFVPSAKGQMQECRKSVKAERFRNDRVESLANCQIGGIVSKAEKCRERFGQAFSANALQTFDASLVPKMPGSYLCERCQ